MGVFSLISNSANLRQSLMPFQLKPGTSINSHQPNSTALNGAEPQFFSFKESKRNQGNAGGFGLLNICPSSFKQFMDSDIGYKLLYNYTKQQGITKESITANSVFDNLPSLQIREFAVDSELDQLLNLFRDLVNIFNPGDKNAPNNSVKNDSTKGNPGQGAAVSESKNIADKIKGIWEELASKLKSEGFYEAIFGNKVTEYTKRYVHSPEYNKVIRFPFAIYYKLLSCVTTNMYEVPIHPDVIVQSQSEGFGAEDYAMKFPGAGFIGSIPIIGKVITRIMSTISINTSPIWDPSKTAKDGPTVNCKFKLFNDTVDAAIYNFIFVNTIAANNMWYNYSIFKRAPALYDIKINGVYRYYMCTATVNVKPAGPVRKVPIALIKKLFTQYNSLGGANANLSKTVSKYEKDANNAVIDAENKLQELEAELANEQQNYQNLAREEAAAKQKTESEKAKAANDQTESESAENVKQAEAEQNEATNKLNISDARIESLQTQIQHAKNDIAKAKELKQNQIDNASNDAAALASGMDAIENEFVAIPDIYDVELSFKSQLPNNFNNFLYVYAGNPDIMKSDKGYQENIVVGFIRALKTIVKA